MVESVCAHRMHLGLPDASGRQTPAVLPGSDFVLKADLVIKALGFDAEDLSTTGVALQKWGTVRVDFPGYATSLPGVFAAGDIVRGASLVVWAIRDGREAAASMHRYLCQASAATGSSACAEDDISFSFLSSSSAQAEDPLGL